MAKELRYNESGTAVPSRLHLENRDWGASFAAAPSPKGRDALAYAEGAAERDSAATGWRGAAEHLAEVVG